MSIRNWSGTRIILWLAVCSVAAGVLAAAADAASYDDSWLGATLVLLVLFLLVVPWVTATVWSWNRSDIGNWHFGKFIILGALLLAAAVTARRIDEGLKVWTLLPLPGVPLLALTWSWLCARERR